MTQVSGERGDSARRGLEVWKFGGASLADARAIQRAAGLIARHPGPVVVVASALAGVTDLLLEGARLAAARQGGRSHAYRGRAPATTPRDRARRCCRRVRPGARCSHRSTRRRGSIASSAAPSRCWATFRHAPATSSSPAASACRRRSSPPCCRAQDAGRSTSMPADIVATDGQHGGAAPNLPETGRRARRVLRPLLAAGTTPVVPGFIGQAPDGSADDARTRRIRSDGDSSGRAAGRAEGRALEGRPRDSHRGSAPGAGRAADSAAAPSRGGRGRALRREGAASARAHPDRRHADRAARPIVPRSRGAGHRSLRAPIDGDRTRSRRWRSCGARRSSPSRARAWSACTASPRGRSAPSRPSGCRSRRSSRHRPRARSDSRSPSRKRRPRGRAACGARSAKSSRAGLIDNVTDARRHGGDRRRRRRHGRQPRHCRARVLGARDRRHQRRRDRAGIVGAQHLVRCDGGPGGGGGAPRPRGVPAVEDRRRPSARGAADRRGVPRIRPRRPCARRSDGRAGQRPARGTRRRPARSIGLRVRAARHLAAPAAAADAREGRRGVARRRSAESRRPPPRR